MIIKFALFTHPSLSFLSLSTCLALVQGTSSCTSRITCRRPARYAPSRCGNCSSRRRRTNARGKQCKTKTTTTTNRKRNRKDLNTEHCTPLHTDAATRSTRSMWIRMICWRRASSIMIRAAPGTCCCWRCRPRSSRCGLPACSSVSRRVDTRPIHRPTTTAAMQAARYRPGNATLPPHQPPTHQIQPHGPF